MSSNGLNSMSLPNSNSPPNNVESVQATTDQLRDPSRSSDLYRTMNVPIAFHHLPVQTTITGRPAQHQMKHLFLRDLPAHAYTLPSVPLNFTVVEIIVLLPNFFKNKAIAARFLNNHMSGTVHFAILEEHRHLGLSAEFEKDRARRIIADEYRKTMRMSNRTWTKASHLIPAGWDSNSLAMDGFEHDDVPKPGYIQPASIPFRDLAVAVKKLPEGTNAGDLTRALQFSLQQPEVYMFPDDLPTILNHIGRTQITLAHTDRWIVQQYTEIKRKEDHLKKFPWRYDGAQSTAANTAPRPHQFALVKPKCPPLSGQSQMDLATDSSDAAFSQPEENTITCQPTDQVLEPDMDCSSEAMDALLRPHLNQDSAYMPTLPASPPYAPHSLLRDCIEGDDARDQSSLAQAARFARRPDQICTDWYMKDTPFLAELLSSAQYDGKDMDNEPWLDLDEMNF